MQSSEIFLEETPTFVKKSGHNAFFQRVGVTLKFREPSVWLWGGGGTVVIGRGEWAKRPYFLYVLEKFTFVTI